MNKSLVILGFLMILVFAGFFVFVSALQTSKNIEGYGTISGEFVEAGYVDFKQGWNMIYGLPSPGWLSGGTIESSNIKAIYGFNPVTQDYIELYPHPDKVKLESANVRIDTLISLSAFWVYSNKAGRTEYMTLQPLPLEEKELAVGWNFIGITPDMQGKSIGQLKGNCDIVKVAFWDKTNQKWMADVNEFTKADQSGSSTSWDNRLFADSFNMGEGIAFKVSSNCNLGTVAQQINPPAMP